MRTATVETTCLNATPASRTARADEFRASVLVFRTTVNTRGQVAMLAPALAELLGRARWTFDLEDRDRVLRIEHKAAMRDQVIELLVRTGFMCAELD